VPTQTKPDNPVAEIEDRLRELERQHRRAEDAIRTADQRIREIATRQHQIAVAVVSEDPEAAQENEQLEETLLIETRRAATAKSAAQQLTRRIGEAKEDLAEAKRQVHRQHAKRLAEDRYALEEEAEAQITALSNTLGQLKALDARQRHALSQGGVEQGDMDALVWNSNLQAWLRTRLAGFVGATPKHQEFATKTLQEVDPLSREGGEA
jgi:small-conductance mechanosensitive channel